MIHRKEMSRKILQCVDRGLAVGLIAGMLLFAGLTAWWYVSFMDNAIVKWLAWMMIVAVCVVSFVVVTGYGMKRLTGMRIYTVGALVAAWLLLGRFDFPRIGWTVTIIGGILGVAFPLFWNVRSRGWRTVPVVLTVVVLSGGYVWLHEGMTESDSQVEPIAAVDGINIWEYGAGADTLRVDGSAYFKVERRIDRIARDRIWGFDNTRLPLHGTLFYPDSGRRLPLVAIIHGSHYMLDRSDRGYDYLAVALARRGYAVVTVDENFINKSFTGGYGSQDYIGRGWLLLKNLEYLRAIASDADSPLSGVIDFDRVALMGHSRGGDGIAAATWLNGLEESPAENGEVYDFGFGIKSVIEIAPTGMLTISDGSPYIYNNVDCLLLQGDKDGDVSFMYGLRRYNTATFSDSVYHFKVAVNIAGANHGQFNTAWGADDRQPPAAWFLDRTGMLTGEEQRNVATVYITAFLDASLKGEGEISEVFINPLHSGDIVQWADTRTLCMADFESDVYGGDVVELTLRDRLRMSQLNHGVKVDEGTEYRLTLDSVLAVAPCHDLVFSAYADEDTRLSMVVYAGDTAALSDTMAVTATLPARLSRSPLVFPIQGDREQEMVMQTFRLPIPAADSVHVTEIRFRALDGSAIVDNIGLRRQFEVKK